MSEKPLDTPDSMLAATVAASAEKRLASLAGQPTPGNDHVIVEWNVAFLENAAVAAAGYLRGKTSADRIEAVVTKITDDSGRFYGANISSLLGGALPGGTEWSFWTQGPQFGPQDEGKTIMVSVQGSVNAEQQFYFEKSIVIPKPQP